MRPLCGSRIAYSTGSPANARAMTAIGRTAADAQERFERAQTMLLTAAATLESEVAVVA